MLVRNEIIVSDFALYCLSRFINEVTDTTGKQYKAKTLLELVLSLQQHINDCLGDQDSYHFLSEVRFKGLKKTLDGKIRQLNNNVNNIPVPRKASVFSDDDENKLWETKQFGTDTPIKLLATLLFYTGLNFALRGYQEQSQSTLSNFEIDPQSECLTYYEHISKNNQRGIKDVKLKPKVVKCFKNLEFPERCLVTLYKTYIAHIPFVQKCTNRFYLYPVTLPEGDVWYSNKPLGEKSLSKIIKQICHNSNITGYFTAHSMRATTATRLYQTGVDEQLICEITGHRSLSVRDYKRTSDEQRKTLSNIVNCNKIPIEKCTTKICGQDFAAQVGGAESDFAELLQSHCCHNTSTNSEKENLRPSNVNVTSCNSTSATFNFDRNMLIIQASPSKKISFIQTADNTFQVSFLK